MIVKLGLAAADGPGAGGPAGASQGHLAGGAASLIRTEDSETGSGSDSESEPSAYQDPPEDSVSELEVSQPDAYNVKHCEFV